MQFLWKDRMEQLLFALAALVLVAFCSEEAKKFCHQQECPDYNKSEPYEVQDFEVRLYPATEWITTKITGTGNSDVVDANSRLKDYCKRHVEAGYKKVSTAWPALITVTDGEDLRLSWFVPPGTPKPEDPDPSVTLISIPAAVIYVRVFGGVPSIKNGQENVQILRKALDKAQKFYDHHIYLGVGYDSFWSLTHHNEIWIYAA